MVYCATGNPGKLREFRLAAGQDGIQVETVPGFAGLPSCAETGATFEANAILRSEEHTSELQSPRHLVFRLLLEKKKKKISRQVSPGSFPALYPVPSPSRAI